MSQSCYNEYNSQCCQNQCQHNNCCCGQYEKPKVRGKFGLAFVLETPDRKCVQPCGWQVELCGTPSSIEHTCNNMLDWVKCPPLSENETIQIDTCKSDQIQEDCSCSCCNCHELCNYCCSGPPTTRSGIRCLINKFENMSHPCRNCVDQCECLCEPNISECCRTATYNTPQTCCCSTSCRKTGRKHKTSSKKKLKVTCTCDCAAQERGDLGNEETLSERIVKDDKEDDDNSTSNDQTENYENIDQPVKDKSSTHLQNKQ